MNGVYRISFTSIDPKNHMQMTSQRDVKDRSPIDTLRTVLARRTYNIRKGFSWFPSVEILNE